MDRAFPCGQADGMTLRDYFAAKALDGMLSSPPVVDRFTVDKARWTSIAYEWADAMLKERSRG
jgi:hypothetical protein